MWSVLLCGYGTVYTQCEVSHVPPKFLPVQHVFGIGGTQLQLMLQGIGGKGLGAGGGGGDFCLQTDG
jgi:hypothetical protein